MAAANLRVAGKSKQHFASFVFYWVIWSSERMTGRGREGSDRAYAMLGGDRVAKAVEAVLSMAYEINFLLAGS